MRTKLVAAAALLSGAAMLSGANLAWADTAVTVAPTTVPPTEVRTEAATPEQSGSVGPMTLTDSQMEKINAGHHWYQPGSLTWHWGDVDYYAKDKKWHTLHNVYHRG